MKITFHGHSDDTFGYEWTNGRGDDHQMQRVATSWWYDD